MTADTRPGLNPQRLVRLMSEAIDRCRLDLAERTVLTEAANGAYVVTPVLAAMAGANVRALAGSTAYATSGELRRVTTGLAQLAGVAGRVNFIQAKSPEHIGAADIVTNSGQVRPIDSKMIAEMKPSAVVALMYESWEHRGDDLDLAACRARSILVAGTNERHPSVDVFSFLGPMSVKQLHDAGIAVYGSRVVLLCDNEFGPFIERGLSNAGAEVVRAHKLTADILPAHCDAVLVALQPGAGHVFTAADARLLAQEAPGTIVVEYWGDTDREALAAARVPVWPARPAKAGHMAVLPSAVGPEPIIRLQAGGLKVGEVLARGLDRASPAELDLVQVL